MYCPYCQTFNPPEAKFCMECGNHLPLQTCQNCQTINPPQARFCIECGCALAMQAGEKRDTIPLAESGPLSGAKHDSQIGKLSAPEERRVVTIMFADITGSTPLADRLDPEDMRAILVGYFNLMTEQIRRHGGTVEKYIGDAVMAIFGSPVAHEDDPDRAIRAALDMQTALANFNTIRLTRDPEATRLQMRIGINTGEVAAPGAQSTRQDFLITGDAVNVAARLQQVGTPDTILVGERTYLATRGAFEFRSLAPLLVKGKEAAINAWTVQSVSTSELTILQAPRGIAGLPTPMVGRQLEMTLMHATYARVRDAHHSHLITLLGPPGVGKSRMVKAFIDREVEAARSTTGDDTPVEPRVLQGRCPPYGEGITYWPLVEILRSLILIRGDESNEELERRFIDFLRETLRKAKRVEQVEQVAEVLLQGIGHGLHGQPNRGRLREPQRSKLQKDTEQGGPEAALQSACRVLLEAIAQVQPLILVIDDLQWADDALLKLLEYLTIRINDFPILFVCLGRPELLEIRRSWAGGQPNFTTIILDALTPDETSELIRALLATDELPDVILHSIKNRAEGNPFFVEEIIRMLIDQETLVKVDGTWEINKRNEEALSELASPATPPEDTLIDQHYVLPLPRLPDTIQGVLAARVDLLSAREKQILQAASIVGRTFWASAVLELVEQHNLDHSIVLEILEILMRRDFIERSEKQTPGPILTEQSFSFKHILIRDVVYHTIPRTRRSQKHAQLALWLETQVATRSENFAELLAYHYQQALANWPATLHAQNFDATETIHTVTTNAQHYATRVELVERTIHYLILAGDLAFRSYYTIRAIQAYTEALELLQENGADALTVAHMHHKLGRAYVQRINADSARREYLQALQLMKAQPETTRQDLLALYLDISELSTRWLGWFNTWLDMEEVRGYLDEGLALVIDQPPSAAQSAFLTYQAIWHIIQMKYTPLEQRLPMAEHALKCGLEARAIAEAIDDSDSLWIALDALGFVYAKQHRHNDGHLIQHQRQALQHMIQGREELYDLYMSLGANHTDISDFPTAVNWFGQAWRIAQTMESPTLLLHSIKARLKIWWEWNRIPEAQQVANNLLQTSEQYQQDMQWSLIAIQVLMEIAYYTGQREESERLLRQYRKIHEELNGQTPLPLANLLVARREWVPALEELRMFTDRAEPFPRPGDLSLLAELSVLANEPDAVQAAACTRALETAQTSGTRKQYAIALRARGRLSMVRHDWTLAEIDLHQTLTLCQDLDLPWEMGKTLVCLGQLYLSRSTQADESSADDLALADLFYQKALGFFEALHITDEIREIRATLTLIARAGTSDAQMTRALPGL